MNDRLEQLMKMLEHTPDEPFVLFAIGQEYSKKNDAINALIYYERLVATHPDYTGVYYHIGKLYQQLGRKSEAIATFRAGMEITQKKGDHHAYGELQSALSLISDEE